MILLLCLLIFGTAAYIVYELMEADRAIWKLGERESHDLTPFIRRWFKGWGEE